MVRRPEGAGWLCSWNDLMRGNRSRSWPWPYIEQVGVVAGLLAPSLMHHLGAPTPYEHPRGMLVVAYWPTSTWHAYMSMWRGVKFRHRVQKVTFGRKSMRLGPHHIAATTPNPTLQSCRLQCSKTCTPVWHVSGCRSCVHPYRRFSSDRPPKGTAASHTTEQVGRGWCITSRDSQAGDDACLWASMVELEVPAEIQAMMRAHHLSPIFLAGRLFPLV
jgi:hypothetical protein